MLREEWQGRLEATRSTGEVAFRPGPLAGHEGFPFHRHGGALLNPAHVETGPDGLRVARTWTLPPVPLPPPPEFDELDPQEVLALVHCGKARREWVTRAGRRPCRVPLAEALARHPELVRAGRHYLKPGALRSVVRGRDKGVLTLEDGTVVTATWRVLDQLAAALGLGRLDRLEPQPHPVLYQRGLRDWPKELLDATTAELRAWFAGDLLRLLEAVIWQVYRSRSRGRADTWGRAHRDLYYNPVLPILSRAGHLPVAELLGSSRDHLYLALQDRLDHFVGEWRLFTYCELGFDDLSDEFRRVGEVHPHVLLVVEKDSLALEARVVSHLFGVSLLILGGVPRWIAVEYLSEALRPALEQPVRVVSYCDHDPYGWYFPALVQRQLDRYNLSVAAPIARLVLPSRFTPAELERITVPLSTRDPGTRRRVRDWVKASGGVNGRPLGLYADYLRPAERVVAAFREETDLVPVLSFEEALRRAREEW